MVPRTGNGHWSAYPAPTPMIIRLPEWLTQNLWYKPVALRCSSLSQRTVRLADIVSRLDAIILIGGADIHPSYYNEEPIEQLGEVDSLRDVYDIALIRLAAQRNVPMLGICRGEQLINVAFGGTLYQDIPAQYPDTTVRHNQKRTEQCAHTYGSSPARLRNSSDYGANGAFHKYASSPGGEAGSTRFPDYGMGHGQHSRSHWKYQWKAHLGSTVPPGSINSSRRQYICQILPLSGW